MPGIGKKEIVVLSVGYERRSVDELIELLSGHDVILLLDVREAPFSRRTEFRKNVLAARLSEAGIAYQHLQAAGNPHRKKKVNIRECLSLYENYLRSNPNVVDLVVAQLGSGPVAMLCYERQHADCHRSILLDALTEQASYKLNVVCVDD